MCWRLVFFGVLGSVESSRLPQEVESATTHLSETTPSSEFLETYARQYGIDETLENSRLPEWLRSRVTTAIVQSAQKHDMDPRLILAVIHAESGFNPWAVSPVGAVGLMQIMPETGTYWIAKKENRRIKNPRLFDPLINVDVGAGYLAELLRKFGSLEKALIAYNAGPNAAVRILKNPEVKTRFLQGYPKKVVKMFSALKRKTQRMIAHQETRPSIEET